MDKRTSSDNSSKNNKDAIEKTEKKNTYQYTTIVGSLAGIIPTPQEPDDAEYLRHLEEK
ncbi:MAG: hypothetical protein J6U56_02715 [Spirochaetia bacterium]|nr:hypothetical protein [Spirochaetia bacterium]